MGTEKNELLDGLCEFCKQSVQYSEEIYEEAKRDPRIAGKLVCMCPEAAHFRHKYRAYEKGLKLLKDTLGEGSSKPVEEEVLQILKKLLRLLVDRKIRKVTINISTQEKATMEFSHGKIKINREIKKTDKNEVEII